MLASATAAVFLVALSQTPGASALKLSQGPKSEAVDLQKEAKTLASVVQTAGSKIFQELKSNGTDSTIYEATEIRTLSAIIGRWLLLQNRVTSTRTPLSIAQKTSFDKAVEHIALGRVLLGTLFTYSGNDGRIGGQKELLQACPVLFELVGSSVGVFSEGWLSCYVTLPELLPMTTSTTERTLLMQSVTRRIPWLLDAVLTSIAANDHSELISVASELSLADRKMLAVQFRAAWDAAVRLRSQYRASILSFFNSVTKSAQLAAFNRARELQEITVAEYQDLAGNALVNSEAESEGDIAPTGASLLNIRILQRRLGEEIRQEAAMYLTLMEEVIVKGDVSLEEFKRSSKAATLGFQSRADVAAVFEEVYQQIIDAERQAHLAANDAASFKDSKAAKTPKSRRHKSSKKHSTSDSPPSATEDAPQRKRSADSKRAPSSKPSKASAPPKAPRAPPMTPLQYVWSMLTYTGVLVTMLAAVATAGGQYIRTVRAKQQRLAKAKKDLYLRPATGAGAGTGGTSTARRSAMANKSYLAMPLTQLISKIEVEEQFAVRSYSQLVLENIQLFCTEVFICSRNALTAVYEAIARRVEQVQQSPWVTQLLDYAEGKNTKFPVSLPMMPGTEEEVDAEDVISSLLVELEAEMAAAAKPAAGAAASGKATAARKNKHGSKARRGNKPKAKCPTASGEVEDRSATAAPMDGEGGTAEVTTRDAEPFADPEKESTGALKAGEETDQQGEQGGCQRQESEDSTEAALNISSDSGYRLDQEQEQEHEHHYSDSQGGFANAAEDDGDVDPILLEELMASMQGYAEAVAAASHARTADEGEWISTSGRRNNRGTAGQNNTAKQLHRQQLLRKTAEALFVSNKASANRSDAWRNAKWDKIKTAAMKRFISGVPNPLTVSPDTVAASAAMHNSKPATGSNAGDVSRTAPASAHQFHHPMPRRLSAAAVANMHHSGIAAAPAAATAAATAPRDRRVQTVASEDSLRAHYPHQSRVSDEGEQSSLTDSDTSEPAHHSSMPSMSGTFHSMHPPVGAAGQVPMMPNPMESNSVFQYCSMLQHYYQQQCNMMSSMGWTYVLSSPMPVASPAPEYSAAMYTPVAVPTGSMGPIMRMSPQPQSMHVPVISAAQNAAFPPLPSGRMQRSRSVSAEYFQPIQQGPALPRPGVVTGQYSYGVTNNSTPTVSPYYTGESPHGGGGNRFTPSPGISLATAMLAVGPTGSTGAGGGGTSIAPIHRPRVEEEALVAALQKQIEYYFSADNLLYDTYLRHLMDDEGFVHLSEIANFRRVVKLTVTPHQLLVAVHTSSQLEVKEAAAPPTAQSVEEYYAARLQGAMIRCAENPTRWVIPPDALSSPVSGSVKRSTATPTPTGVTSATLTPTGAAVTQEASNGEERGAEALPHDN